MIPDLKHDQLIERFGGRFKLTAVIQKRWRELLHGARPMVDPEGMTDLEIVVKEIMEGKVVIDARTSDVEAEAE